MGRWAGECLLSLADLPEGVRRRARVNALFYTRPLAELAPSARMQPLLFPTPPCWWLYNPTIAAAGEGWLAIARSSNYLRDRQVYRIFDRQGIVRTQNYLLPLAPDLTPGTATPIADRTSLLRYPFSVTGFEDCRLFRWRGDWFATATTREHDPHGVARLALLRLRGGAFDEAALLPGPDPERHEKNWMPLVIGDELYLVYSCSPTVILQYDGGRVVETSRHTGPVIARELRGGSQGVPFDGGHLFAAHEAVDLDSGDRAYLHRLVLLDADLRVSRVSSAFYFLSRGIEFCCGMARQGDTIALTFGADDARAFVVTVEAAEVRAMLRPVYG